MKTFSLILAVSDQVVVAIGTILLASAVLITAILKYKVDDFVKFWAAVGSVIGLALGGVGTYFFTKDQVTRAESSLKTAEVALQISESQKAEAVTKINQLASTLVYQQPVASDKLNEIQLLLEREQPLVNMFQYKKTTSEEMDRAILEWLRRSPTPLASPKPFKRDKPASPTPSNSASPSSSSGPIEPEFLVSPAPSTQGNPK